MADALTGRTARKQYSLAAEAQAAQRSALARQEADLAAVEAGQRRMRQGGGGGLLAYIDRRRREDGMRQALGGEVAVV